MGWKQKELRNATGKRDNVPIQAFRRTLLWRFLGSLELDLFLVSFYVSAYMMVSLANKTWFHYHTKPCKAD